MWGAQRRLYMTESVIRQIQNSYEKIKQGYKQIKKRSKKWKRENYRNGGKV